LFLAAGVGEAEVRELDLLFFYELEYITRCHIASGKGIARRAIERASIAAAVPARASWEIKELSFARCSCDPLWCTSAVQCTIKVRILGWDDWRAGSPGHHACFWCVAARESGSGQLEDSVRGSRLPARCRIAILPGRFARLSA
jgi:hypothetical protein